MMKRNFAHVKGRIIGATFDAADARICYVFYIIELACPYRPTCIIYFGEQSICDLEETGAGIP